LFYCCRRLYGRRGRLRGGAGSQHYQHKAYYQNGTQDLLHFFLLVVFMLSG
jgi:hypothetical protein